MGRERCGARCGAGAVRGDVVGMWCEWGVLSEGGRLCLRAVAGVGGKEGACRRGSSDWVFVTERCGRSAGRCAGRGSGGAMRRGQCVFPEGGAALSLGSVW